MAEFAGCVYRSPEDNPYAPRAVGDLTRRELDGMRLEGLPIKVAHGKHTDVEIGKITSEFTGKDGSKHINFEIFDEPHTQLYREGLKQHWYTHLSLGHDVDPKRGMVPKEVSICHLGARNGTTIFSGTDLDAYKHREMHAEQPPVTMAENSTSATPNAPPEEAPSSMDLSPDAPPAETPAETPKDAPTEKKYKGEKHTRDEEGESPEEEKSPEEKALEVIQNLSPEQQDAIAKGWTMTSQKLADTHAKLENAQKSLEQAEKQNETLKIATQETAKQLVSSLKEAYEEFGTPPPERYMNEIQQQTLANPTLAQ